MAKQQPARMRLCWVAAAVTVLLLLSLPLSSAKTATVPSRTGVLEGAVQTTVPAEVEKARFGGSDADSRAAIDDVPVPVSDAFTQSGHDEASTKLAESGDPPGWSLERVLAVFYTPVETVAASNPAPHIDGRAAQHQLQEDTHVDDNEEDEHAPKTPASLLAQYKTEAAQTYNRLATLLTAAHKCLKPTTSLQGFRAPGTSLDKNISQVLVGGCYTSWNDTAFSGWGNCTAGKRRDPCPGSDQAELGLSFTDLVGLVDALAGLCLVHIAIMVLLTVWKTWCRARRTERKRLLTPMARAMHKRHLVQQRRGRKRHARSVKACRQHFKRTRAHLSSSEPEPEPQPERSARRTQPEKPPATTLVRMLVGPAIRNMKFSGICNVAQLRLHLRSKFGFDMPAFRLKYRGRILRNKEAIPPHSESCPIELRFKRTRRAQAVAVCNLRLRAAARRKLRTKPPRPSPTPPSNPPAGPPGPKQPSSCSHGREEEKAASVQIFVQIAGGRTITVDIKPRDLVAELKHKVQDKEGIPAGEQRLVFGGKQLCDERTLESYDIVKESTVCVVFGLGGGGGEFSRPITQPVEDLGSFVSAAMAAGSEEAGQEAAEGGESEAGLAKALEAALERERNLQAMVEELQAENTNLKATLSAPPRAAEAGQEDLAGARERERKLEGRVQELEAEVATLRAASAAPQTSESSPPAPGATATEQNTEDTDGAKVVQEAGTKADAVSVWKTRFQSIDTDNDGVLSMKEMEEAMKNDMTAIMSVSVKLRQMFEEAKKGFRSTVTKDEFAAAMNEFFMRQYCSLYNGVSFPQLLAAATVENLGHPELRDECNFFCAFQSLKNKDDNSREKIARFLLQSIVEKMVPLIANLFTAGRQYEEQETSRSVSKFNDMVLGHPKLFELGVEGILGLPDFDFEKAMEREHASSETFTAWNNDKLRETSPLEQFKMVLPQGWAGTINGWDYRREKLMCKDFMEHTKVKEAGLKKPEVVVARLYTGPMYKKYNEEMRSFLPVMESELKDSAWTPEDMLEAAARARKKINARFPTTILILVSGLLKLRLVDKLPDGRLVFRGFSGLEAHPRFMFPDEKGNRGGVDSGFMSTSMSREQALGYIDLKKGKPQLLQIEVGQVDRGAQVDFLSYFPAEQEVLMPPMSALEVVGEPTYQLVDIHGEQAIVQMWKVRLNVNVKGRTLEQLESARKGLFLNSADEIKAQVETDVLAFRDTELFKNRARTDVFLKTENDEKKRTIKEYEESILSEWNTQVSTWDAMAASEFNTAAVFSSAYSRLLEMLQLTELKKRYWLHSPEINLDTVADLSLKDTKRRGLARNRRVLNAESTAPELKEAAAKELLSFMGAASDDIDKQTEGETPLLKASAEGDLQVVALLLPAKADLTQRSDKEETPLILAAQAGHEGVCQLLLDAGTEVDAVTEGGRTAIYKASQGGFAKVVELLISKKANVNLSTKSLGQSPLDVAAYDGHVECVSALIASGAKVDAQRTDGATPVYYAAQNGHVAAIEALVNARCDVNLAQNDGATPVWVAAQQGHAEAVSLLIQAKCDVDKAENTGCTPVWVAAATGHAEAVSLLIQAKCDVDKAMNTGCTPVFMAAQNGHAEAVSLLIQAKCDVDKAAGGVSPLDAAAYAGHVECVSALIASRAKVDAQRTDGATPVFYAAQNGHVAAIEALVNARCDVNLADNTGCTPVFMAAQDGHAEAVSLLIQAKCDVDKAMNNTMTPLAVAASKGHVEAVKRLVAAGADKSAQTKWGTALQNAKDCVEDQATLAELVELLKDTSTLHGAVEAGDTEAMARLIEAKCDVDEQNNAGKTAVYMAAEQGQIEAVSRLIEAKCDVDKADTSGATPVLIAAANGHVAAVEALVNARCDVNLADNDGGTPVFMAAQYGHAEAVSLLIQAKCDVDKADNNTMTPLAVAASQGHVEAVKRLVAAGADKSAQTKWGTALQNAKDDVKDQATLAKLVELLE